MLSAKMDAGMPVDELKATYLPDGLATIKDATKEQLKEIQTKLKGKEQ